MRRRALLETTVIGLVMVVAVVTSATGAASDRLIHVDRPAGEPTSHPSEGDPQPAHEWEGTAPAAPGIDATLRDEHEFDVLPGFENDLMTVSISWEPSNEAVSDLNLGVERLDNGTWTRIDFSSVWQLAGDAPPVEKVTLPAPAPGRYRAYVWNRVSLDLRYRGRIAFSVWTETPVPQTRAESDREDIGTSPSVHTIYFIGADRADEALDTTGVLEQAVLGLNGWLRRETGGRQLRLDGYVEDGIERLDVTFVRGFRPAAEYDSAGDVINELQTRGFRKTTARGRYLVFVDAPMYAPPLTLCGVASGAYATVSMELSYCRTRHFGGPAAGAGPSETVAMHELLHTMGAVSELAPHHCTVDTSHLCTAGIRLVAQNLDPEYYDPMFNRYPAPLRELTLDAGHDDYYGHSGIWPDVADSPLLEG